MTEPTTTISQGGQTKLPIDDMGGTIPFPGAGGVTYPPGTAVDCWMEFDAFDNWSTAAGPVGGQYDVQAIATHESGHWLGVSHSTVGLALPLNAETATMVPAGTSGNIDLRSLAEDDIASIIRTYARNSTPPGSQTVGGRAVIEFNLMKGAACVPATGVAVWAYETSGGLNGANRVETFSGSQFRDPLGEPYNGSVKLNVPPGGPYTIYARTLEDNGTSSGGLYSAFRYSNTTINSNTMDPNALTQEFDNLATVAAITAGSTVNLGTVGFLGCWLPVATSDIDIEMMTSTAPATATLGGDIAVTSSFTNQGSAASEPFEVGFYFSGDATIDTDDAFTGFTCAIGGLGSGASDSCDGIVPVPAVAPGTYFVGALADIHNVVHENNELNNAFAAPPQVVVSSDPLNPIVNPSFEDNGGSFHGWNIKELSRASNPQLPLTVVGPGYEYPAPFFFDGCCFWLDYFASQPTDGAFAAVHDFNGDDQGTLSTTFVNRRELYQDLTLPAGTTTLEFDYRAAWELYRFGATQDRTFGVEIQPAGGGAVLHAETILNATWGDGPPDGTGFEEDTDIPTNPAFEFIPYPAGITDLSAFAGQDIRLMFVWNVPEPGTGFAYFQLDNVRLNVTPGAVTDIAITSVGAPASTNQGDIEAVTVTVDNVGDQDVTNLSVSLTPTAGGGAVTVSPQLISLTAGASTILNFTWDTGGASLQDHTLTGTHDLADDNAANDLAQAVVTVNGASPPPTMDNNLATADFATARGTIDGGTSYLNTHQQGEVNGFEELTEEQQGGNSSNARSLLDHTWEFNVVAGSSYVFKVDAFHSGTEDDFDFSYSRDNSTFTPMLTVTKTSDDDVEQMYMFPEDVAGTLYVRVEDTDNSRGTVQLDTLFVDSMVIMTITGGGGNTPPIVTITAPVNGSSSDEGVSIVFAGTANDSEDGDISANLTWTSDLDGNLGTAASLPISTLSVGTHNITASLNDSGGLPGSDSITVTINSVGGPVFTLSASGYKVKGVHHADLTWSGAPSLPVNVYRNEAVVATTSNDGEHTDNTGQKGPGSYAYQVCEAAGSSTCSNVATVNF